MPRSVLAVVVALALIGGAVAAGRLSRNDDAPDNAANPNGQKPAATKTVSLDDLFEEPTLIKIEAELPAKMDGPIEMVSAAQASGGKALSIPERPDGQELNPPWKTKSGQLVSSKDAKNFAGADLIPNGVAVYEFQVEEEGKYYLWARHYWGNSCANSFSYKIDQGPRLDFFGDTTEKLWKWGQPTKDAKPVHLAAGTHKLVLMNREDGMKVDKFLLTTTPPPGVEDGWIPTGKEGD